MNQVIDKKNETRISSFKKVLLTLIWYIIKNENNHKKKTNKLEHQFEIIEYSIYYIKQEKRDNN